VYALLEGRRPARGNLLKQAIAERRQESERERKSGF
jgi:hypothetical protein